MTIKCWVLGCTNRKLGCNASFHSFPKDEELQKQWLEALNLKPCQLTNNSVICGQHFTKEDFTRFHERTVLRNTAVPSVFRNIGRKPLTTEQQLAKTATVNNKVKPPSPKSRIKKEVCKATTISNKHTPAIILTPITQSVGKVATVDNKQMPYTSVKNLETQVDKAAIVSNKQGPSFLMVPIKQPVGKTATGDTKQMASSSVKNVETQVDKTATVSSKQVQSFVMVPIKQPVGKAVDMKQLPSSSVKTIENNIDKITTVDNKQIPSSSTKTLETQIDKTATVGSKQGPSFLMVPIKPSVGKTIDTKQLPSSSMKTIETNVDKSATIDNKQMPSSSIKTMETKVDKTTVNNKPGPSFIMVPIKPPTGGKMIDIKKLPSSSVKSPEAQDDKTATVGSKPGPSFLMLPIKPPTGKMIDTKLLPSPSVKTIETHVDKTAPFGGKQMSSSSMTTNETNVDKTATIDNKQMSTSPKNTIKMEVGKTAIINNKQVPSFIVVPIKQPVGTKATVENKQIQPSSVKTTETQVDKTVIVNSKQGPSLLLVPIKQPVGKTATADNKQMLTSPQKPFEKSADKTATVGNKPVPPLILLSLKQPFAKTTVVNNKQFVSSSVVINEKLGDKATTTDNKQMPSSSAMSKEGYNLSTKAVNKGKRKHSNSGGDLKEIDMFNPETPKKKKVAKATIIDSKPILPSTSAKTKKHVNETESVGQRPSSPSVHIEDCVVEIETDNTAGVPPSSSMCNFYVNKEMVIKRRRRNRKSFVGDFKETAMENPVYAKKFFNLAKLKIKTLDKKLNSLKKSLNRQLAQARETPRQIVQIQPVQPVDKVFSDPQGWVPEILRTLVMRNSKMITEKEYSEEEKSFAVTLYHTSIAAYEFVRKAFGDCLPHPTSVKKWHRGGDNSISSNTAEILAELKMKKEMGLEARRAAKRAKRMSEKRKVSSPGKSGKLVRKRSEMGSKKFNRSCARAVDVTEHEAAVAVENIERL